MACCIRIFDRSVVQIETNNSIFLHRVSVNGCALSFCTTVAISNRWQAFTIEFGNDTGPQTCNNLSNGESPASSTTRYHVTEYYCVNAASEREKRKDFCFCYKFTVSTKSSLIPLPLKQGWVRRTSKVLIHWLTFYSHSLSAVQLFMGWST